MTESEVRNMNFLKRLWTYLTVPEGDILKDGHEWITGQKSVYQRPIRVTNAKVLSFIEPIAKEYTYVDSGVDFNGERLYRKVEK